LIACFVGHWFQAFGILPIIGAIAAFAARSEGRVKEEATPSRFRGSEEPEAWEPVPPEE
jgi:hypothetical protein